jgi:hypothetical protein
MQHISTIIPTTEASKVLEDKMPPIGENVYDNKGKRILYTFSKNNPRVPLKRWNIKTGKREL